MMDTLTRRLAVAPPSRRGVLHLGLGAVLAGFGLRVDQAHAAGKAPTKKCDKGSQCCTGKCKQGECIQCANGATFVGGPDPLCWLTWGNDGDGNREFVFPSGVAAGGAGRIHIADTKNHRIVRARAL
jgi:hypothetical protein